MRYLLLLLLLISSTGFAEAGSAAAASSNSAMGVALTQQSETTALMSAKAAHKTAAKRRQELDVEDLETERESIAQDIAKAVQLGLFQTTIRITNDSRGVAKKLISELKAKGYEVLTDEIQFSDSIYPAYKVRW